MFWLTSVFRASILLIFLKHYVFSESQFSNFDFQKKFNDLKSETIRETKLGLNSSRQNTSGSELAVAGGDDVVYNEFPFMAALYVDSVNGINFSEPKYICGGILITSWYILTAAHCVNNVNKLIPQHAKLGAINLNSNSSDVQNIAIEKTICYPLYNKNFAYHDIALIKLKTPAELADNVIPKYLQTQYKKNIDLYNKTLLVVGWGAKSVYEKPTNILQKSQKLTFVEISECNKYYKNFFKVNHGLTNNMICAVDLNKKTLSDACSGDSGGPLLVESTGSSVVVGIVSFGQACGSLEPSVYTFIYPYVDWIESIIWYI